MDNPKFNDGDINAAVVKARAIAEYCLGRNKQDHYENYSRFANIIEQVKRERDDARAALPVEVG